MEHLNYEVAGRDDAPAIALIHGILSSNLQWAPNRDALAEDLRVISIELWGHGNSPAPSELERYEVSSLCEELERIRRSLGVDRWVLCGQSFGAGLAIRYLFKHPETTAGLVVTNSRSAFNDVTREETILLDRDAWAKFDMRTLPFHARHAKRFPPELKARMEAAADGVKGEAMWGLMSRTIGGLSCRDDLGDVAVPTLLVNGRYEKKFQPDRDYAAATIPDIEVVDVDAGHSPNIEAAEDFTQRVRAFCDRVF